MKSVLAKRKLIGPKDTDLLCITDDTKEVVERILNYMREVGPPEVTPRALA
jgi:predicted Rossmann-fold nucleotide-binding protein